MVKKAKKELLEEGEGSDEETNSEEADSEGSEES